MSIKSFSSQTANDVFLGDNTNQARKLPMEVWPAAVRRLELLNGAKSLRELVSVPGLRLEKLDDGFHRIRINNKYRIKFRFEDGEAHDVDIEKGDEKY